MAGRAAAVAALAVALGVRDGGWTQELPLETALAHLDAYITRYEPQLSALVADETFEQSITVMTPAMGPPLPRTASKVRLTSTISFVRLPGEGAWLGVREVRAVNRKTLPPSRKLLELLQSQAEDRRALAAAIARASAAHNLGSERTINMPTLPLEFVHPRNRTQLVFEVAGFETIQGAAALRLNFREVSEPTLILAPSGHPAWSTGAVWIEGDTGQIRRASVEYGERVDPSSPRQRAASMVQVEFADGPHGLGLLVPVLMREEFHVPRGRGVGVARYSNFRRFETSGRIVPQG